MKKLLIICFVILLNFVSCNSINDFKGQSIMIVTETNSTSKLMCVYSVALQTPLVNGSSFIAHNDFQFIDTVGKYKVGDTLIISKKL